MNDGRLLDCNSVAEVEENLIRMIGMVDLKAPYNVVTFWTPVNATAASGTLTIPTNPTANDTMTIGAKVYTFKAAAAVIGDIVIGVSAAATQLNIRAAINGTDGLNTAHPVITCGVFAANVGALLAIVKGAAGNIVTTETFTAIDNVFGAASLTGGLNGTVGFKGQIMVDATKIYVCTETNTILDSNWKSAALT